MELEYYGLTDVGRKREKNEDSYLIDIKHKLFVVADGMGGHLGGEYASRMAVNTVEGIIESLEDDPDMTLQMDDEIVPGDYKSWLRYAIQVASHKVYEKARVDNSLHGMGTTTVLLFFKQNRVYVANVGDSRGYLMREGTISQLTQDHSLVGEQLRAGMITESEVRAHKLKNIITRSVGFQEDVEIDVEARPIKEGDTFLLCTDGLSNLLEDREIKEIVSDNTIKNACHQLVDIANERGGDDNITVVMVRVVSLDEADVDEDDEEETTIQL